MSLPSFMFYFFEAIVAMSAFCLIFVRHVFYGALLLILCLLGLAGIYILAFAEFLAVTQILVYAGGILVVIIFGIMLTTKISGKPLLVQHANVFSGLMVGIMMLGMLIFYISQASLKSIKVEEVAQHNAIEKIGVALMSTYLLPFEIAGLLLLMALIGAAVIASFDKQKKA